MSTDKQKDLNGLAEQWEADLSGVLEQWEEEMERLLEDLGSIAGFSESPEADRTERSQPATRR